jgi:hypothetical protein
MSGRARGGILGFAVATLFVLVGAPVAAQLLHTEDTFLIGGLALPAIATGIITGYLFGRRGSRPADWSDRTLQSFAMAFVATSIGDLFVGFALGYASADGGANIVAQLVQGVLSAFVLWPFGMVIFGVVAMPVTFAAALVWALAMELFWPDGPQVSGSAIHSPSAAPTATKSG